MNKKQNLNRSCCACFVSSLFLSQEEMGPWEIFEEEFREINALIVRTEVVFGVLSKLQFGSLLNKRNLN